MVGVSRLHAAVSGARLSCGQGASFILTHAGLSPSHVPFAPQV